MRDKLEICKCNQLCWDFMSFALFLFFIYVAKIHVMLLNIDLYL